MKQVSFNNISLRQLRSFVDINPELDESKFADWLEGPCELSQEDRQFIQKLIAMHKPYLRMYGEEELKMKFLAPILNRVNFRVAGFQDWYERPLKAEVAGVELAGKTDFMVARGIHEPDEAVFFIQEFKPTEMRGSPEIQLVAELLVAIQSQETTSLRGAYIHGQLWYFVVLERLPNHRYLYYVSDAFDSLQAAGLERIYCALLAVKAMLGRFNPTPDKRCLRKDSRTS